MNKEITLQVPGSLFYQLSEKAEKQGVSIEALCLSMLSSDSLVEPYLYGSLSSGQIREEIEKVVRSNLPKEDMRKRVRQLEVQMTRHIR